MRGTHPLKIPFSVALVVLMFLVGCGGGSDSDSGTGPIVVECPPDCPPVPTGESLGLVVSEPVPPAVQPPATASGSGAAGEQSWVSLPRGTFPQGNSAIITNLTAGGLSVTAPMVQGGFDPVPIEAAVGEELETSVRNTSGVEIAVMASTVKERVNPIVLRTEPEREKVGVALLVAPTVTFSEPIDPLSATPETIQLLKDGAAVEGTVSLIAQGVRAVFEPATPLDPETPYTLVITTDVRDTAGDALQEQITATFTTQATPAPPPPPPPGATGSIIFSRFTPGEGPAEIHIIQADGSGGQQVGRGNYPSRSPDGSRIAFDRDGDIWISNADGSSPERIAIGGEQPEWSPDGTRILFTSQLKFDDFGLDGLEIAVVNTDGTGLSTLTQDTDWDWEPTWSPDGTRIAFMRCRGPCAIWVMNADGTGQQAIATDGPNQSPAWSPDGLRILFSSNATGNDEINVMNVDGTGRVQLTDDPARDRWPAWSPDGTQIVFSSFRGAAGSGDPPYNLWVMNADGTDVQRITQSEPALDWKASWR